MANLITNIVTALKPKRRWAQFSLATMFLVVTVLCVWLAAHVRATNRQRAALAAIKELGGRWFYDYQLSDNGITYEIVEPPVPKWLLDRLDIDHFANADRVELWALEHWDPASLSLALTEVKKLGSLRSLWVQFDWAKRLTPTEVELFASLTGVRGIEFMPDRKTDALVETIERLPNLEALDLLLCEVGANGLRHIGRMTNLRRLRIMASEVGDHGFADVAGLESLVELNLIGPGITNAGLAQLEEMNSLEVLSLEGSEITDAGLAPIAQLKSLRELHLICNEVTDAGLAHLCELTELHVLYVDEAQVTDAGLAHLRCLTKLERLGLYHTKVTQAGIAEWQQALPNCTIYQ
jgi:hypothetical protein